MDTFRRLPDPAVAVLAALDRLCGASLLDLYEELSAMTPRVVNAAVEALWQSGFLNYAGEFEDQLFGSMRYQPTTRGDGWIVLPL